MLPLKLKYSTDIPLNSEEEILFKTEEWFRKNKIQNFYKTSDKVVFKISFFGWSWDKFSALDSGYFQVKNSHLVFEGSLYRTMFFITAFSFLIGYEKSWDLGIFLFVFIFGSNIAYTHYQVKNAFKELTQ